MHTPAKGSPFLRRTRRMSPTWAASGLALEKRVVRSPVGSRRATWDAVTVFMGSLQRARVEGGGGKALIFFFAGRG